MPVIEQLAAREILDSRGRPTVLASCKFAGGEVCSASVPSGASTGSAEAHELRDDDPQRYGGLGCRRAVANINGELNQLFSGRSFDTQAELDGALIQIDGSANKSRLGANTTLAVSLAFARSAAAACRVPLWRYFSTLTNTAPRFLPRLTINLFSGGRHAGGQVSIQDVMVVPMTTASIDQSLAMTYRVYQAAAKLAFECFQMRLLRADEGGLAPPFRSSEEMIEAALVAVERAGFIPGADFAIAIDVAASQFHSDTGYDLDGEMLSSEAMIERVSRWVKRYPVVSIEDGLSEDDWRNWPLLKQAIGAQCLLIGDDFLCTNRERITLAVNTDAANALLLKVNQVGTLTEAAEAYRVARAAGWAVILSVRSGETEDDWAADLSVGWQADCFKNGSITQSERLAKYNRLLAIEEMTGLPLRQWNTPQPRRAA